MAKQVINIGTVDNDGTGDTLKGGGDKINDNFTELYGNNIVPINQASDFPTAAANVITLVANTSYKYSGDLSIGADRFDTSAGNITIYGTNPNTDKITSTTTGALFTGASIRLRNIGCTVSSGSIFDMSGLGVVALDSFFIHGAGGLGTVNATGLFSWMNSNITALTTTGLLFSGVCRSLLFDSNSFSDFEGTAIDLGTATASLLRIDGNRLAGNVGATSIEVAANSANIAASGEGWMVNNFFNGDGTASVGTNEGDDSWVYRDNAGVANSSRGGDGYILGNAVATVISTINTPVPVNFNSSFIADHQSSFTVDTDGCFTYTGKNPVSVLGTASVFGDSTAGNNQGYRFYFAKDTGSGFVIDLGSVAQEEYDSSDPHSTSISGINVAETGDKFCLYVECISGTTNITIETASIHILGF
jgi:hypothetical protein